MEAEMIDINELEEGVLIEANDFNVPIQNLINDVTVRGRDLDKAEIYKLACNITGSLVIQNYVSVVKTQYKQEQENVYAPLSSADLSRPELDAFLAHPEKWDEMGVFSETEPIELHITEKGRDYLSTL